MGDDKADQPGLEMQHHQDEDKEQNLLQDEPEIV